MGKNKSGLKSGNKFWRNLLRTAGNKLGQKGDHFARALRCLHLGPRLACERDCLRETVCERDCVRANVCIGAQVGAGGRPSGRPPDRASDFDH